VDTAPVQEFLRTEHLGCIKQLLAKLDLVVAPTLTRTICPGCSILCSVYAKILDWIPVWALQFAARHKRQRASVVQRYVAVGQLQLQARIILRE